MTTEADHEALRAFIRSCGPVAVAFSGGVDSTLVLNCALDALGAENVLILLACSELQAPDEIEQALRWLEENGHASGDALEIVEVQPLAWEEFVRNEKERCYHCKHRIYSLFRERMELRGFSCLLDGTNTDDLQEHRPGLRALRELEVRTPLVAAGMDKAAVRRLSRALGLATWDRPSASCLATRIPTGMAITSSRLQRVSILEEGLRQSGLIGCRVRLNSEHQHVVSLEIREKDFPLLAESGFRVSLTRFFHQHGIEKVLLDLVGRQ